MKRARYVGPSIPPHRAIRDKNIVTGCYPPDIPIFIHKLLEGFSEIEHRPLPKDFGKRLEGKTVGILVERATDTFQFHYSLFRTIEEGGNALILGRKAGEQVTLGSPTWPWGEKGPTAKIQLSIDEVDVRKLDALLLPGGIGTWIIRGNASLKKLVQDIVAQGKTIGIIDRAAKILMSSGVLQQSIKLTVSPAMQDDLRELPCQVLDTPVYRDQWSVSARGTEDLPTFFPIFLESISGLNYTPACLHRMMYS